MYRKKYEHIFIWMVTVLPSWDKKLDGVVLHFIPSDYYALMDMKVMKARIWASRDRMRIAKPRKTE